MKINRSITEPIRRHTSWTDKWAREDKGLIHCWEQGRDMCLDAPTLANRAKSDQLVPLPWKGGVERKLVKTTKFGTLYYLAMWQGLRGDDLLIDTDEEPVRICTATGMTVTFTGNPAKYSEA